MLATLVGVDTVARRAQLDGGDAVPYDTLILATGARDAYFGHSEWEPFAPGLKTIEDATTIRRRILTACCSAKFRTNRYSQVLGSFFEEDVKCYVDRKIRSAMGKIAVETRDFYLACFLRCTGYELIDLRAEGPCKIFVFRDRTTRRDDVLAFDGDGAAVPPLAFSSTIKDMKALLHNV